MILPYLDFGLGFLGSTPEKNLKRLQILQNKILKCALCKASGFSTRLFHKLAGVLLVKDRIRFNTLVLIHLDNINNSTLFPVTNRKTVTNPRTRTTNTILLELTRPQSDQFHRSFCYQGVLEWNNLSNDFKNSPSLQSFKS